MKNCIVYFIFISTCAPAQVVQLIDSYTKEPVNYERVDAWIDGTKMNSLKADGIIYRQKGSEFYKRKFDVLNVQWFGALPNDGLSDYQQVMKAINFAEKFKNLNLPIPEIYFPNGKYLITQTINLPAFLSLRGENQNSTILDANFDGSPLINVPLQSGDTFTIIRDLTLQGKEKSGAFEWKPSPVSGSIGIKLPMYKVKLTNLQIQGFSDAGIEVNNSFYIYIDNCLLINNKIGLHVTNTSTSVMTNLLEVRLNSIGVKISGNSYANQFINFMCESNFANYLPFGDFGQSLALDSSKGLGVVISNSFNNHFQGYFENQQINVQIFNSNNNTFEKSLFVPSAYAETPVQIQFYLLGSSSGNKFANNQLLGNTPYTWEIVGNNNYTNVFEANDLIEYNNYKFKSQNNGGFGVFYSPGGKRYDGTEHTF